MATYHGNDGIVKVGANQVGEVKAFTLNLAADTKETTAMGSMAKTFKPSKTSWDGEVTCMWDPTDTTGQEALVIGTSVSLTLAPMGTGTSGDVYYTGSGIITAEGRATTHEGIVERTFSFQGTGALTETTTP